MTNTIIAFAGSTRRGSLNDAALALAVTGARAAGANVAHLQLREYPMPLYDADFHAQHGLPEAMLRLRRALIEAQGFLIASPEYNASITPLLKNTIDWLSQSVDGASGRLPFEGKIVGLMGASAGAFGTVRALPHVATILSNLGAIVLPVLAVPRADKLFHADGSVADAATAEKIRALAASVVKFTSSVA